MPTERTIFVKPAPIKGQHGKLGLVRDPVTLRFLAEDGEHKPRNTYWMRRIRFGDVVLCEPKKPLDDSAQKGLDK